MDTKMKTGIIRFVVSATAMLCVGSAGAEPFRVVSPSSLVVVRLGDGVNPFPSGPYGSSVSVFLDEYDVRGPSPKLVNTINLPSAGSNALTLSTETGGHDGHLHLSTNRQFMTLAGYRVDTGYPYDPASEAAADIPRVIGRMDTDGNIDTSTALVDNCDWGAIRGAVTDDGTRFWTAGDNASGANDGGLRFALLGASHSTNLSRNQVPGSSNPTTDNPREVGIADGQLYVGAGSNASIGKAMLKCSQGLPTSGSQSYTRLYPESHAAQSFVFLDLDPSVTGVDVLYTASSNPSNALRKYSLVNGEWRSCGWISLDIIENVTATKYKDEVVIFAATDDTVYRFVDTSGYNGSLKGTLLPIITAGTNTQFRGLDYLPLKGDVNLDGIINLADFAALAANWLGTATDAFAGDLTGDRRTDGDDLEEIATHWLDDAELM
jgi:hypothetical protein